MRMNSYKLQATIRKLLTASEKLIAASYKSLVERVWRLSASLHLRLLTYDLRLKNLRLATIFLLLTAYSSLLFAQDIHFSQFNFSPLSQNPAFTGVFDGDVRFVANYRNQWFTVPVSYNTFSFSTDGNVKTWKETHGLSLGGMFYYDRAGDSRFSAMQAMLSAAYQLRLGATKAHSISVGASVGMGGRTIQYQYLYFDNQYTGDRYNPNLQSGEQFPNSSFYYPDVAAGLSYQYTKSSRKQFTMGIGIHHLNQARQSFLNDKNIRLDLRYTINTKLRWQICKKLDLVPEAQFQYQDTKYELAFGVHTKAYIFKQNKASVCLNTGAYYRNNDAFYLLLGMDYNAWQVNLSYDINTSKFQRATQNNGAIEGSLIYILSKVKKVDSKGADCQIF